MLGQFHSFGGQKTLSVNAPVKQCQDWPPDKEVIETTVNLESFYGYYAFLFPIPGEKNRTKIMKRGEATVIYSSGGLPMFGTIRVRTD